MPPVRSIQLIGKSNAVGLSRDLDLVAAALRASGCEVAVTPALKSDSRRRRSLLVRTVARARRRGWLASAPRFDINVMLEHIWPQYLHLAPCNVAIPNPEWFDWRDRDLCWGIDRVWAKTAYTARLFSQLHLPTTPIGFDSEDRYDPAVPRERVFFHLAGKSRMKGTARLLAVWARHPHWPRLIALQDESERIPDPPPAPNVEYRVGFIADAELRRLQNACRFHLCPSEAEGWGHYIVEALGVGAVVITNDAPPMNELVSGARGCLVRCHRKGRQNQADTVQFDVEALEAAVERLMQTADAELDRLGAAARGFFEANHAGFAQRVGAAVQELGASV
jgi:glycosyltransferase involved in cell wall biosynthesis